METLTSLYDRAVGWRGTRGSSNLRLRRRSGNYFRVCGVVPGTFCDARGLVGIVELWNTLISAALLACGRFNISIRIVSLLGSFKNDVPGIYK